MMVLYGVWAGLSRAERQSLQFFWGSEILLRMESDFFVFLPRCKGADETGQGKFSGLGVGL
jgi:hypothetical protein